MTDFVSSASNPFPAEAVATYGKSQTTCDSMNYMRELRMELSEYLTAYAREESRYGGAVGLRGGHGSGKTHVLTWLADVLRSTRTIRGTVLYGKCDSSRIFDLYRQLMERLDRSSVIELIQLALLNLARAKVRSAKVTESLLNRLETTGSLLVLQGEQNLDLEQLRQQLMVELQSNVSDPELVRVLLDVPNSSIGADAYRWLTGNEVVDLAPLGITHQLAALPRDGAVDSDSSAIAAFDAMAALHRMAGVPLVVLVDQLEVLLRTPNASAFETLGSLIKKFVERLALQSSMVFIAGTPEAWGRLQRDVSARFRRRDEVAVGSLSLGEVRIFLDSYTDEKDLTAFTDSAVSVIHELSGGSPREILRIAYHAFEATSGDLALADDHLLTASARQSGSIDDRAKLALVMVDGVLTEFGKSLPNLTIDEHIVVDRVLLGTSGEVVLAFVILKATDALDEIDSARRVQIVHRYREEHWAYAELVLVAVGYSSSAVRDLLGTQTIAVQFDEKTFSGELRARLVALSKRVKETPVAESTETDEAFSTFNNNLREISARLAQLEKTRIQEVERIQQRYAGKSEALSQSYAEDRKVATRREALDAIESLVEHIRDGDIPREREILRSILVANEAYLHNAALEEVGDLYMEFLAMERLRGDGYPDITWARERLIAAMRDSLRRPTGPRLILQYSRSVAFGVTGLLAAFVVTAIVSAETRLSGRLSASEAFHDRLLFLPYPSDFIAALPFICLALTYFVVVIWVIAWSLDRVRRRSYTREIRELQNRLLRRTDFGSHVRRDYPQA